MNSTNPHEKYTRAWFAWNGRKGGRAGVGASKRRTREHYAEASAAGVAVRQRQHNATRQRLGMKPDQPAETDPYSGT